MIRITKSKQPPPILRGRGRQKAREHCVAYASAPKKYRSGEIRFEFDRGIYADETVKAALRTAQHDKCAFCESKVPHVAYGDVEHFRPKAGSRQGPDEPLQTPGYYWLAYEWKNLFFCCQICNQRHKQNLFPLLDPKRRARSHHRGIAKEQPLFIDPAAEDPAEHIGFREEFAFALNGSARGTATIDGLRLNRPELLEKRRASLKVLIELRHTRDLLARAPKRAQTKRVRDRLEALERVIEEVMREGSEYAAMARAVFAAG